MGAGGADAERVEEEAMDAYRVHCGVGEGEEGRRFT